MTVAIRHGGWLKGLVALALFAFSSPALAQTVNVLLLPDSSDKEALAPTNPILSKASEGFAAALNSAETKDRLREFGFQEIAAFHHASERLDPDFRSGLLAESRSERETFDYVREQSNVTLDAIVVYAVYARAVPGRNTESGRLSASVQYSIRDVANGRFVGSGDRELSGEGSEFPKDCDDKDCIVPFVTQQVSKLLSETALPISLQILSNTSGSGERP